MKTGGLVLCLTSEDRCRYEYSGPAVVADHATQSKSAASILRQAETIAISSVALCELGWVLRSFYKFDKAMVAAAIRQLLGAPNVAVDSPAIDLGLAVQDAGGDFADGVIAFESARLGGETFVSFDQRAVTLLSRQGRSSWLLDE